MVEWWNGGMIFWPVHRSRFCPSFPQPIPHGGMGEWGNDYFAFSSFTLLSILRASDLASVCPSHIP
jgi:hypothetical protein